MAEVRGEERAEPGHGWAPGRAAVMWYEVLATGYARAQQSYVIQ